MSSESDNLKAQFEILEEATEKWVGRTEFNYQKIATKVG
jgi:hypothetical protein